MPSRSVIAAVLATALLAGTAHAQTPDAQPGDIVVQGQAEQSLRGLLEDILATARDDQLARFNTPICPQALGMRASYRLAIEKRIRENVRKIGLKTAKPGCRGNLIAIVSEEPPDLIAYFNRKVPGLFDALRKAERADLEQSQGPVWAWQAVTTTDSHGLPPRIDNKWDAKATRIGANTRQTFLASFVILDVDEIDGLTLQQLADFITIRSLAKVRESAATRHDRPTILTLFSDKAEGRTPAPELAAADLSMLRALYATPAALSAKEQRRAMISRMISESSDAQSDDEQAR